jgi:hypothetical protein
MVVQTHEMHPGRSGSVGLHIGSLNVQQYFPPDVQLIELELDHLRIVCPLEPSFWLDRPEIHDQRLSSWLESKRNSGKLAAQGAPVALIPCGESSFRLQILTKDEADRPLIGPPSAAYFAPSISPIKLLDRRKHSKTPRVERRRVVRLKVDERPAAAAND